MISIKFSKTKNTVAGILAGFQSTVDQLTALQAERLATAHNLRDTAHAARREAYEHEQEAAAAEAAAAKIQALIS